MSNDDIRFSIIGVALGLVLGFLIGNWTMPHDGAAQQAGNTGAASTSVNAPRDSALPEGHPPITPGETVRAGPLPAGSQSEVSGGTTPSVPASASSESVFLPSLDPLPASSSELRAEKKYKNIQMFKGLPADRIESIMFAFKNSLGVECTYCHIKDQFEKDDKTTKQTARKMISIVRDSNAKLGAARVSCFTCHRGQPRPAE